LTIIIPAYQLGINEGKEGHLMLTMAEEDGERTGRETGGRTWKDVSAVEKFALHAAV
jgi:hypothetical protein